MPTSRRRRLNRRYGALADGRLPGATRLSHVLAIGAKFKLEQQGKQQQLVSRRSIASWRSTPTGTTAADATGCKVSRTWRNKFLQIYQQYYDNPVNRMWLANAANLVNPQIAGQAMGGDCRDMLYNLPSYGKSKITAKDLDFSTRMDAYVLLNYPETRLRDLLPVTRPKSPTLKTHVPRQTRACTTFQRPLLKESLYRDGSTGTGKTTRCELGARSARGSVPHAPGPA